MKFLRDDDGSATIEFVLWTPFLMAVIVLIVDVSLVLFANGTMYDQARTVGRDLAVGAITDTAAEEKITAMAPMGVANVRVVRPEDGQIVIAYELRGAGIAAGIFDILGDVPLSASYAVRDETYVPPNGWGV